MKTYSFEVAEQLLSDERAQTLEDTMALLLAGYPEARQTARVLVDLMWHRRKDILHWPAAIALIVYPQDMKMGLLVEVSAPRMAVEVRARLCMADGQLTLLEIFWEAHRRNYTVSVTAADYDEEVSAELQRLVRLGLISGYDVQEDERQ